MCTHEIAARQCRMIAGNEAFSIEVIKMIEDSGVLIHLWARWWGTFCMCECLRGRASMDSCICAGVCVCVCLRRRHSYKASCELGLAWRRPERCGAMPTGGQMSFHYTSAYVHCSLIWPSSERSIKNPSVSNFIYLLFYSLLYKKKTLKRSSISWVEVLSPFHRCD